MGNNKVPDTSWRTEKYKAKIEIFQNVYLFTRLVETLYEHARYDGH